LLTGQLTLDDGTDPKTPKAVNEKIKIVSCVMCGGAEKAVVEKQE